MPAPLRSVSIRTLLLTCLAVTAGFALGVALPRGGKPGPRAGRIPEDSRDLPEVARLLDIEADPGTYEPGRNLFAFFRTEPPSGPSVDPPVFDPDPPPITAHDPLAERPDPAPTRPPALDFRYIGFVGPIEGEVAVLKDAKGRLVVGEEGEVVREHFRILSIGRTCLEMGYVAFGGSQPLPLGGGAPGAGGRS